MTTGTILFNPFTGQPRHPSDIASDPKGLLIWDGEEPLRAAKAVQPSQAGEPTEAQLVAGVKAMRLFVTKNSIKDFRDGFVAAINAKESK